MGEDLSPNAFELHAGITTAIHRFLDRARQAGADQRDTAQDLTAVTLAAAWSCASMIMQPDRFGELARFCATEKDFAEMIAD